MTQPSHTPELESRKNSETGKRQSSNHRSASACPWPPASFGTGGEKEHTAGAEQGRVLLVPPPAKAAVLRRLAEAAQLSADVRNLISSKNRPLGFPRSFSTF